MRMAKMTMMKIGIQVRAFGSRSTKPSSSSGWMMRAKAASVAEKMIIPSTASRNIGM